MKKYWYFSAENKRLRYGDDRKIKIGITHTVEGKPVLCQNGLHASKNILDALSYAPGNVVWRVGLSGDIFHSENKSVATARIYLEGGIDVSSILRKFARMCVLDVIHLWEAPQIVIDFLKTGRESLKDAAGDAARAAAWAAAGDAAGAAAWAAAGAAAWDAAWDAAGAAARDAAGAAAWDAARAARDAAWAARDAARDAQLEKLKEYL